MSCLKCGSSNQTEYASEINLHLPHHLRNADKVGVFVFPRVQVCLDCGSSSFMTPASELEELRAADFGTIRCGGNRTGELDAYPLEEH
jgi:hypothetical protein